MVYFSFEFEVLETCQTATHLENINWWFLGRIIMMNRGFESKSIIIKLSQVFETLLFYEIDAGKKEMNYPKLLAGFLAYAVICIQGDLFDLMILQLVAECVSRYKAFFPPRFLYFYKNGGFEDHRK